MKNELDTMTLELAPIQQGEPQMKQLAPFDSYRDTLAKLKTTAETLTVTDVNQRAEMKLARATRLTLKDLRVEITHRHKELKEGILREGQSLDAGKRELLAIIEPLEARLMDQEQFIERETARIEDEKRIARTDELTPFLFAPVVIDLGKMTDSDYAAMLIDCKTARAVRLAREQKEADELAAKIKAEAAERERIRLENEQLKKEAIEREEKARKEREAAAAELAKEREEAARIAREEKAKADAEADKLRKEREATETADRLERLRLHQIAADARAEVDARKEAEAKVIESAKIAAAAAAAAPEKEKLNALAKTIREINMPILKTAKGAAVMEEIAFKIEILAFWIAEQADQL